MPATIPDRPDPGDPIVAAWGGDVHDRIYNPQGVAVSGPALVGIVGVETKLPLDTLAFGNAAYFDNANDQLLIPAGGSGLYLVVIVWGVQNTLSWVRMRPFRNGGPNIGGDTLRGIPAITAYSSEVYVTALSDADRLEVRAQADAADAADVTVVRFSITRIGNNPATSGPTGSLEVEALPAPEDPRAELLDASGLVP